MHEWNTWEIAHDGEGERGKHCLVASGTYLSAIDVAWESAEYFDEQELREDRSLSKIDLDGCSRVIEVECQDAQENTYYIRYRVFTRVTLTYEVEIC